MNKLLNDTKIILLNTLETTKWNLNNKMPKGVGTFVYYASLSDLYSANREGDMMVENQGLVVQS